MSAGDSLHLGVWPEASAGLSTRISKAQGGRISIGMPTFLYKSQVKS